MQEDEEGSVGRNGMPVRNRQVCVSKAQCTRLDEKGLIGRNGMPARQPTSLHEQGFNTARDGETG